MGVHLLLSPPAPVIHPRLYGSSRGDSESLKDDLTIYILSAMHTFSAMWLIWISSIDRPRDVLALSQVMC